MKENNNNQKPVRNKCIYFFSMGQGEPGNRRGKIKLDSVRKWATRNTTCVLTAFYSVITTGSASYSNQALPRLAPVIVEFSE